MAVFVIAQICVIGSVMAAPVTLKCTMEGGRPVADLIVDVAKKTMVWGISTYVIHAIDDRYISAYQNYPDGNASGGVGGEVWVLNRTTGKYVRAGVGIGWNTAAEAEYAMKNNVQGTVSAQVYSGQCSKPVL